MTGKPAYLRARPPLTSTEFEGVLEIYRQRAESLSVLDDEVANIMATLAATGELDNTYVVFTSDNGFMLGEHRLPKTKNVPYDPSLRLPLLVRGPGVPAGEVRTDPLLTIDIAPTLLALAGDPDLRTVDGPVDGRVLSDVLLGGDRGWDRPVLVETGPRGMNARVRAKLPASARGRPGEGPRLLDRPDGPSRERFTQGVRTGRWLYLEHASREQELYDVAADPRQVDNLADAPRWQGVRRQLAAELERLRDCVGAECRAPLPPSLRTDSPAPAYVPDPARTMRFPATGPG
jgi:arylsulfatase A-like enzyme